MPFALFPLVLAAFAIGTTEFVIMGLLPDVARDLAITIPQAGLLVSGYAMGVVVGGPILAVLTASLSKRRTLLGLFAIFITGNILCAISPTYGILMGARVITAFAHGTFLGVAAVVAMALVPKGKQSQAIGFIFTGITLANVIGVPAGIALGHVYGWRSAFAAVVVLAVVAMVLLYFTLPNHAEAQGKPIMDEIKGLQNVNLLLALSLSMACSASLLCLFTFITPFLLEVTHVTESQVTLVLLIFGFGLTLGTTFGGMLGGDNLLPKVAVGLVVAACVLVAMPWLAQSMWPCAMGLFAWGMVSFGLCPLLQTLVMGHAGEAPTLASTLNHSAFNLGNAIGAWVGAAALSYGQPIAHLPWTCVGLSAISLAIVAVSAKMGGNTLPNNAAPAHGIHG